MTWKSSRSGSEDGQSLDILHTISLVGVSCEYCTASYISKRECGKGIGH